MEAGDAGLRMTDVVDVETDDDDETDDGDVIETDEDVVVDVNDEIPATDAGRETLRELRRFSSSLDSCWRWRKVL